MTIKILKITVNAPISDPGDSGLVHGGGMIIFYRCWINGPTQTRTENK